MVDQMIHYFTVHSSTPMHRGMINFLPTDDVVDRSAVDWRPRGTLPPMSSVFHGTGTAQARHALLSFPGQCGAKRESTNPVAILGRPTMTSKTVSSPQQGAVVLRRLQPPHHGQLNVYLCTAKGMCLYVY